MKKQVAVKSSGRKQNVEHSSSSAPIIEPAKVSKKKALLAERGFISENPSEGFSATVTALGWGKFVKHRKEYIGSLVRDFYKGIQETTDGKPATVSIVRGEEVRFDARTINDYYGLGYFGKAIENKQKNYGLAEMNEVKARICSEDAVWEKSGEIGSEFKLLKKYLCDEANMWFHFVRHSLLPTSHTLCVEKERLLVIDAIMSGGKIEVGRMINREINKYKNRKDGNLYFPCLITDLCIDAQVEIEADELREEPMGAFPTKFKPRQRPGNATAFGDSQTLQRLVMQQNSLAKFVKEQFEWQKKVNAHLTKGKMVITEPVLPEWMTEDDEDEIDEEPLSKLKLKAVKKEKAKRMRSPVKKKQSPAKKKQKKVSSEEEEFRSSEMENISEPDAEETRKVSLEVLSEDDSEATESEAQGSSSDKTDIEADSPPTMQPSKSAKPRPQQPETTHKPSSPINPPTNDPIIPEAQPSIPQEITQPPPTIPPIPTFSTQAQTTIPPTIPPQTTQESSQPSKPVEEVQPVEDQPDQPPAQEESAKDATASAVATAEVEKVPAKEKSPAKKQRVKLVMTQSPFGRKKRGESAAVGEGEAEPMETDESVQQHEVATTKRQKLQVKKKAAAAKGKPATATSGAFIATGKADAAVAGAAAGSQDATASTEQEVEKAHGDPEATKQEAAAELARKQVMDVLFSDQAEKAAKATQEAPAVPAANPEVSASATASEGTTVTAAEGGEKKKERKKKEAQSSQLPPRQSGRLRSGALNK